jgi:hypothetical protein
MKTSGVILLLVVLAGALDAQAPTVEYKRSFFAVGAAFTIGDSVQTDNLGYGFSANGFQYFDPSRKIADAATPKARFVRRYACTP